MTIACLLLFVGATGKSAQIPLHVWLPDAMEGPTPVSALIHAATMVTAGVYLVARLGPLYHQSETAMLVVAVTGAVTALMAGTIAIVQTDIKRVLAYSTVSQLGFMFLAAGVGAFGVAVFHLFTHAFFKALLFLGSGSVIHAMSGEQDMRRMGGLRKKIPWTFWTFLVGDAGHRGHPAPRRLLQQGRDPARALVSGHTGALRARPLHRAPHRRLHGAAPLPDLLRRVPGRPATPSTTCTSRPGRCWGRSCSSPSAPRAAGFVKIPHVVEPVLAPAGGRPPTTWPGCPAVATALRGPGDPDRLVPLPLDARPARLARLGAAAGAARVRARSTGSTTSTTRSCAAWWWAAASTLLWKRVDAGVIDGSVNGIARAVGGWAETLRPVQTGFVRHYALLILAGAVALVSYLLWS